jgi:hypothetical protein
MWEDEPAFEPVGHRGLLRNCLQSQIKRASLDSGPLIYIRLTILRVEAASVPAPRPEAARLQRGGRIRG